MDKQQQSICPIDHDHGSQGWAAYLDLVLHMFFDEESTDIRPFPGDIDDTKSLGEGKNIHRMR